MTVRQNILANIPVYNLGLMAAQTHYEGVVKAVVLLCREPKWAIISLPVACISIQKRIRRVASITGLNCKMGAVRLVLTRL